MWHDTLLNTLNFTKAGEKNSLINYKGDWKAAKVVIDKDRGAVRVGINRKRETALHIAAAAKHTPFVKELVKYMNEEEIC